MLRCSNETLSRVTFECDSAVSIIRESDQLKYPRYTVLEVACGKESVIARSCREVDYVRYTGIHANLQEIGVRNKVNPSVDARMDPRWHVSCTFLFLAKADPLS